jgi:hypothetical protein
MSNSYRIIIVAASGLTLLVTLFIGAYFGSLYAPDTQHYKSETAYGGKANPSAKAKNGLADITGMDGYTERVIAKPKPKDREERENRDLAAQENSAVFAYWVFWAVVLQTFLAGGALFALIKDLRQNRASAEAQLRAYITIDPGGINEPIDGKVQMPYNVTNCGQTPAYNLSVFGDILIVHGDPRDFNPHEHGRLGYADASTDIALGPGQNQWNYAYGDEDMLAPFWDEIAKKESAIVHYGFLQYRDVFNVIRKTNFAFYHWGEELSDDESKRCRFGNNAT